MSYFLTAFGMLAAAALVCCTVLWLHARSVRLALLPLVDPYGAEIDSRAGFATFAVHDVTLRIRPQLSWRPRKLLRPVGFLLTAPVSDWAPDCHIRPLRFLDSVRRWTGQGLLTGENAFDDMYFVNGSEREKLHQILDNHAQAVLLTLYGRRSDCQVRAGQFRMFSEQPVLTVAHASVVLLERFLGLSVQDIEFVDPQEDSGPVRVCDETACPVCGEKLKGKIVYCRRCQVPHHKECWAYAQGCAIYGCGETKRTHRQRVRTKR